MMDNLYPSRELLQDLRTAYRKLPPNLRFVVARTLAELAAEETSQAVCHRNTACSAQSAANEP